MKRILALTLAMILLLSGCAAAPGESGGDMYDGALMSGAASSDWKGTPEGNGNSSVDVFPGTLTAGEWKDAENLDFWYELLRDNEWYELMNQRHLFVNRFIRVTVKDESGAPCFNVPLQLLDSDLKVLYEARTDINGVALLPADLDKDGVEPAWIGAAGEYYPIEKDEAHITLASSSVAGQLDLMLMVDTTGSMRDELQYLQKELEDVISRVSGSAESLSIRVSVNFYRDEGDEYVIRSFDFTEDISKAVSQLNVQTTAGGGDYPEAVHKALDDIVHGHQWRNDAVKLCFFVLDAPPHKDQEIQGINAAMTKTVSDAAIQGIRIIPVASSGVDTETEFLLRSWALMTGGTYTFLTNHSGIGNDHLEPTIGEYKVEKLNECLIRIICEYCGLAYKQQ